MKQAPQTKPPRQWLGVMPERLEIMQEKSRNEEGEEELEEAPLSGYCENCNEYSENLREYEGRNICDECLIELREK